GPCNSSCLFCSRGHAYSHFDLTRFREKIEEKIPLALALAEEFIFTGSGEYLQLENWRMILDHFDMRYPYVNKMFSTNSSSLRREVTEVLTQHKSQYSIHASLHASNAELHRSMTRMDNFDQILDQISYLMQARLQNNNVRLNLFFVATTLNIDDLPSFVRLAKDLGVDGVVVNYNYIYVPAQKYLSCYFRQEHTNRIFDQAAQAAKEVGIRVSLPPRFGENKYPEVDICRELWSQMMLNDEGSVLPCDASHDCNLNIQEVSDFDAVWNSAYYVKMRRELVSAGHTECFRHCHRANPKTVNIFESHVIHRGREGAKIDEYWEDNF
ncbi:MAG: SPASM domain-containing protein, partial [Candidatus Omnitrophica bacterium]|nr:SPASM domain-containing protein [Candidatus Omnitrophota bacterium]